MKILILINNGALCEQFIGQHLLYGGELYREPELFYWAREQRGSSAEVDYLIGNGTNIIQIEVKQSQVAADVFKHKTVKNRPAF